MQIRVCLVLLVLLVAVGALPNKKHQSRPSYIGCVDSTECGAGNCCVIGMGRYSIPSCNSVHELHGVCRPKGHHPINTTVSYPDGASLNLTNVYRNFCPCAATLACDQNSGTCQDPIDSANDAYNTIIV